MATMREVAALAGVAPSTVSRVLNGSDTVSRALQQRVLDAVKATNYRPNLLGRTLRTSRTNTLAFILPGLDAAPNIEAIHNAELNAQQKGYGMLVADTRGDPEVELELVRNLTARRVDGVLCTPVNQPSLIISMFAEADIPVVFLFSRPIEGAGRFATAVIDQGPAIVSCAQHLANAGHRRVAIVRRAHPFAQGANYSGRFREALAEAGVDDAEMDEHVITPESDGVAALNRILNSDSAPTALIVDVGSAPWMLAWLRELGRHPGTDISLVLLGNTPWAEAVDPQLACIAVDVPAFISKASAVLMALIGQGNEPQHAVVESATYRRRGSVHTLTKP